MNLEVSRIDRREVTVMATMPLPPGMFEPRNETQFQKAPPLAMIGCTVCRHLAYSPVDDNEYDILVGGGLISRYCHRCGAATSWQNFECHRAHWNMPLLYQTSQPDRV